MKALELPAATICGTFPARSSLQTAVSGLWNGVQNRAAAHKFFAYIGQRHNQPALEALYEIQVYAYPSSRTPRHQRRLSHRKLIPYFRNSPYTFIVSQTSNTRWDNRLSRFPAELELDHLHA
jgi:hypothetical protein